MTLSMLPGDRSAEGEAATTAEGDLAAWVCGCTSATGRGGGIGGNSGVVVAGALITEQNEKEGGERRIRDIFKTGDGLEGTSPVNIFPVALRETQEQADSLTTKCL